LGEAFDGALGHILQEVVLHCRRSSSNIDGIAANWSRVGLPLYGLGPAALAQKLAHAVACGVQRMQEERNLVCRLFEAFS
jgi:hypothetical protein